MQCKPFCRLFFGFCHLSEYMSLNPHWANHSSCDVLKARSISLRIYILVDHNDLLWPSTAIIDRVDIATRKTFDIA